MAQTDKAKAAKLNIEPVLESMRQATNAITESARRRTDRPGIAVTVTVEEGVLTSSIDLNDASAAPDPETLIAMVTAAASAPSMLVGGDDD